MTAVPIDHSGRRNHRPEPAERRTFAKVRRGSRLARRDWWGHFGWNQGRRLLLALRIHAEGLRKKGQRTGAWGTISFGAIRLAELLVAIAAKGRGRLEPSADWLAKALNVPAKSIHAWKGQLKAHGFLSWQRRYLETGKAGVRGPQVQQTTNAYWLAIPAEAEAAVSKRCGPRSAAGDKAEAMRRTDPKLADALATLEAEVHDDLAARAEAVDGESRQAPT
ncbi:MAG: hypothetical protein EBR82_02810 [Caulobacteraceae bacterium]|nr:hypothetical protein [Caulobacteraceae bacterium]